jgi:hypothetical protein
MRQQVRLYTQRQVVETLMHGQASAADFVQLEALKFVAMDLGKMQSAVHGTESAMRSLQDELARLRGGPGELQADVLEGVREILAHLRSPADGAVGGGSDNLPVKAREIGSDPNHCGGSGGSGASSISCATVEASGGSASPAKAGSQREFFHRPAVALAFPAAAAAQATDNGRNESLEQDMLNHSCEHRQMLHGCPVGVTVSASRDPDGNEFSATQRPLAPALSREAAGPSQDLICATPTDYDAEGPALEQQLELPGTGCALAEALVRARRSAAVTDGAKNGNKLPLAEDILPDLVAGPSKACAC